MLPFGVATSAMPFSTCFVSRNGTSKHRIIRDQQDESFGDVLAVKQKIPHYQASIRAFVVKQPILNLRITLLHTRVENCVASCEQTPSAPILATLLATQVVAHHAMQFDWNLVIVASKLFKPCVLKHPNQNHVMQLVVSH